MTAHLNAHLFEALAYWAQRTQAPWLHFQTYIGKRRNGAGRWEQNTAMTRLFNPSYSWREKPESERRRRADQYRSQPRDEQEALAIEALREAREGNRSPEWATKQHSGTWTSSVSAAHAVIACAGGREIRRLDTDSHSIMHEAGKRWSERHEVEPTPESAEVDSFENPHSEVFDEYVRRRANGDRQPWLCMDSKEPEASEWMPLANRPRWHPHLIYRFRPEKKTVTRTVRLHVGISEAPEDGVTIYIPSFISIDGSMRDVWRGSTWQIKALAGGIVFLDAETASEFKRQVLGGGDG